MRAMLIGILVLGLMTLPATAQTGKRNDGDTSKSELEHQQLRDLLAAQSAELQATREQLRQLQQRMELLEGQFRAQSNAPTTREVAVVSNVPDTRDPDPSVATVALPAEPKILQSKNGADVPSTNHEGKSDSIELANGKVRIGTLLYADYGYYTNTGFGPQFTSQISPPGPANNGYNTFEITRAYINLFYSPNDAVTFRLTPDLYRQIGAAGHKNREGQRNRSKHRPRAAVPAQVCLR